MSSSDLTSDNSAIVMIDHAVRFGNVFRSHDLSLHVNNTVGLAKTAGVFDIPLVLTNGPDTGPYGPLAIQRMIQAGVVPVTWLPWPLNTREATPTTRQSRDSSA